MSQLKALLPQATILRQIYDQGLSYVNDPGISYANNPAIKEELLNSFQNYDDTREHDTKLTSYKVLCSYIQQQMSNIELDQNIKDKLLKNFALALKIAQELENITHGSSANSVENLLPLLQKMLDPPIFNPIFHGETIDYIDEAFGYIGVFFLGHHEILAEKESCHNIFNTFIRAQAQHNDDVEDYYEKRQNFLDQLIFIDEKSRKAEDSRQQSSHMSVDPALFSTLSNSGKGNVVINFSDDESETHSEQSTPAHPRITSDRISGTSNRTGGGSSDEDNCDSSITSLGSTQRYRTSFNSGVYDDASSFSSGIPLFFSGQKEERASDRVAISMIDDNDSVGRDAGANLDVISDASSSLDDPTSKQPFMFKKSPTTVTLTTKGAFEAEKKEYNFSRLERHVKEFVDDHNNKHSLNHSSQLACKSHSKNQTISVQATATASELYKVTMISSHQIKTSLNSQSLNDAGNDNMNQSFLDHHLKYFQKPKVTVSMECESLSDIDSVKKCIKLLLERQPPIEDHRFKFEITFSETLNQSHAQAVGAFKQLISAEPIQIENLKNMLGVSISAHSPKTDIR